MRCLLSPWLASDDSLSCSECLLGMTTHADNCARPQDLAWRDESIDGDPALDKDPLARAAQELLQDAGQGDDDAALLPAPSLDVPWPPG